MQNLVNESSYLSQADQNQVLMLLLLIMIMRRRQAQAKSYRLYICVATIGMLGFLALLIIYIIDLNTAKALIKQYTPWSYYDCEAVCQDDYHSYNKGNDCCTSTGYDCIPLDQCRRSLDSLLKKYQGQYDLDLPIVIISSILELCAIFAVGHYFRKCNRLVPPLGSVNWSTAEPIAPINQSESDKKEEEQFFESFLHNDAQNICTVCFEVFNEQKTVVLNCGHKFHSKCIRKWVKNQKSCPVCRSNQ